jgi:cytochrome P450
MIREMAQGGTYTREQNCLGGFVLNSKMFPDTGKIALSSPHHDEVRPWLDVIAAGAFAKVSQEELERDLRRQLQDKSEFVVSDEANRFTAKTLARLYAGINLSDDEMAEYLAFQETTVKAAVVPTFLHIFMRGKIRTALTFRKKLKSRVLESLQRVEGLTSEPIRDALAEAIMDALTFAGGLSVPLAVEWSSAVLFQPEVYGVEPDVVDSEELLSFVYETLRRFPLVGFVPMEKNGERQLANVGSALHDPDIWNEPNTFKVRPIEMYEEHFIGFGEPAAGHGPRSRDCVGRAHALMMIKAWLRAVRPSQWRLVEPAPEHQERPFFRDVRLVQVTK